MFEFEFLETGIDFPQRQLQQIRRRIFPRGDSIQEKLRSRVIGRRFAVHPINRRRHRPKVAVTEFRIIQQLHQDRGETL